MRVFFGFALFLLSLPPTFAMPTLRVGVSAPLTGDLAEYGQAVRHGITLALEEHPDATGQIEFIFEDNKYEPMAAVSAFQSLQRQGVHVVYNWGESTLLAVAPLVERMHIPTLAMSATAGPALGKRWIVRTVNHSGDFIDAILNYTRAKGFRRLGLVYTEDIFFDGLISALRSRLSPSEEIVFFENVAPDSLDFRSQIVRLQREQADVVGVFLFPGQVSSWFKQARGLSKELPSFGTDIFESAQEVKLAQGSMTGAVYPNLSVPEQFRRSYETRFAEPTQVAYAYNAYTMAKLLQQLSRRFTSPPTAEDLLQAITKASSSENSVLYRNTAEGGSYFEFPLVLRKITSTHFVDYGPQELAREEARLARMLGE